ncbi:hypothetical protein KF840_20315 [bacterium]|nr:hypothetical protein [bacterium]
MASLPAACGGFLLAVLWFDLMFDVQVRRHPEGDLPEPVLASIAGYYRRVTSEAWLMSQAVAAVMLIGILALLRQWQTGGAPAGVTIVSLALAAVPIALALGRVLPNAKRLGSRRDPVTRQSALARAIWRDHLVCLAAISAFLALQLSGVGR